MSKSLAQATQSFNEALATRDRIKSLLADAIANCQTAKENRKKVLVAGVLGDAAATKDLKSTSRLFEEASLAVEIHEAALADATQRLNVAENELRTTETIAHLANIHSNATELADGWIEVEQYIDAAIAAHQKLVPLASAIAREMGTLWGPALSDVAPKFQLQLLKSVLGSENRGLAEFLHEKLPHDVARHFPDYARSRTGNPAIRIAEIVNSIPKK